MSTATPTTHPPSLPVPSVPVREWHRDGYLISTDPTLIPLDSLNAAFSSDLVYWCRELPLDQLKLMVQSSICFGLYSPTASSTDGAKGGLIGFARLVTDHVTLFYLTDVYVLSEYQKRGLGAWLISVVKEYVDGMPHMRGMLLISTEGGKEEYYAKTLGTGRLESWAPGHRVFMRRGPGSALD